MTPTTQPVPLPNTLRDRLAETSAGGGAVVTGSEWMGGKTVEDVRRFLSENRLKLRKHAVGIMDMKKMQFTMRPIIQAWMPARRSYLTFEYANTPWFKSREERDAVFEAITAEATTR